MVASGAQPPPKVYSPPLILPSRVPIFCVTRYRTALRIESGQQHGRQLIIEVLHCREAARVPLAIRRSSFSGEACVLVRFSDSACRKHVLAPVPRVLGFRPGQPTFKGIRRCALLCATHPHRSSPYFRRKLDCVEAALVWRDAPTSRVCDPSEA